MEITLQPDQGQENLKGSIKAHTKTDGTPAENANHNTPHNKIFATLGGGQLASGQKAAQRETMRVVGEVLKTAGDVAHPKEEKLLESLEKSQE